MNLHPIIRRISSIGFAIFTNIPGTVHVDDSFKALQHSQSWDRMKDMLRPTFSRTYREAAPIHDMIA